MPVPIPQRLLVIDQDIASENSLGLILNHNRYEIIHANSSVEGILTTRAWNPDVIIINTIQTADTGWILCRELREFCQVPILVLSSATDPISIARWLDAGADDYLTKPFSTDVLVALLQKLTRWTEKSRTSPYCQ